MLQAVVGKLYENVRCKLIVGLTDRVRLWKGFIPI